MGRRHTAALAACFASLALAQPSTAQTPEPSDDFLITSSEVGRPGGRLVVALRSEPKTLNPLTAVGRRAVLDRMMASLIAIDRETQQTTPALAKSWTVSPDGRRYTLQLRRGLRFSDGHPVSTDDVVFSFQAYLDERNNSPQRDLLIVGGQPISVRKQDAQTVSFELAEPYAAAERLFDGFAVLPRHLLKERHEQGTLGQAWGLATPPSAIAGLGPFRLKSYAPGEEIVLERNPHYWKRDRAGQRLPYLEEVRFLFVTSDDAQVIRFQTGETDVISRLSAENFALLEREQDARGYRLHDLGPGLEYSFLFFNLNDDVAAKGLTSVARKQAWFRQKAFRQAVSAAIDRAGMVRLIFRGRGAPLGSHVTPGNRLWVDQTLRPPERSLTRARQLLKRSGFTWTDRRLVDALGEPVVLSVLTSASNAARIQMATIIQEDLSEIGISVRILPLEPGAVIDRVLSSHDYEASILAFRAGDADPNGEMGMWLSTGPQHLWHLGPDSLTVPWEAEIDGLLRRQLRTLDFDERRALYDRVQRIAADQLPLIPLVSPNTLVGAKKGLRNFRPAILDHYTLWNAEELSWEDPE